MTKATATNLHPLVVLLRHEVLRGSPCDCSECAAVVLGPLGGVQRRGARDLPCSSVRTALAMYQLLGVPVLDVRSMVGLS